MPVAFRADAGPEIGSGHLIRCRLIARVLRHEGISCEFITSTPSNALVTELFDEGFTVHSMAEQSEAEPEQILTTLEEPGDRYLVVVDSHREAFFRERFQKRLASSKGRWMMITITDDVFYRADIVHNQNLLALNQDYDCAEHVTRLLGPEYAVLDDRYRRLRPESPIITKTPSIALVTLGGSDPKRQTPRVVKQLAELSGGLELVIVVAGGLYPGIPDLEKLLEDVAVETELHVNTPRMPELMARADLAVSSGGMTAWELACLGTPNLILSLTETQRQVAKLLDKKGIARCLGHWDEVSSSDLRSIIKRVINNETMRRKLSHQSYRLVDGLGTQRVVDVMKQHLPV
jgi:UDP-2,4-diacetamido-2,4,6-trideoxy-beta-L-altropyranose hydrolase